MAAGASGERLPVTGVMGELCEGAEGCSEFLARHGTGLFGSREQLKLALGKYAEYRAAAPAERRFAATTWAGT